MFKSCNVRKPVYTLINYNQRNFRFLKNKYQLEKGWELDNKSEHIKDMSNVDTLVENGNELRNEAISECERVSLSRTKREIRELALCNDFHYFGTLTVSSSSCDRFSLDMCQSLLKKNLKKIKRNNKDFRYLIITEKHKDGAFHFHGLFDGLDPSTLIINKFGYLSCSSFDNIGYNSFSFIRDHTRVSNYITKYITKDCVKNSNNQIYMRSKGLRFATREIIDFIEIPNFKWKFENDFVSIYDFDLTNINDNDRMLIQLLLAYK